MKFLGFKLCAAGLWLYVRELQRLQVLAALVAAAGSALSFGGDLHCPCTLLQCCECLVGMF
jgi:hypothetical protein